MSRNKGFTLIELLVVIAIIGILASIILVNLGNTRKQAREASAIASMSSIRSAAEVYFSVNGSYGAITTNSCTAGLFADTDITKLITAATNQLGASTVTCNSNATAWAASASLDTGNFCVDSTGTATKRTTALGTTTADIVCPTT